MNSSQMHKIFEKILYDIKKQLIGAALCVMNVALINTLGVIN